MLLGHHVRSASPLLPAAQAVSTVTGRSCVTAASIVLGVLLRTATGAVLWWWPLESLWKQKLSHVSQSGEGMPSPASCRSPKHTPSTFKGFQSKASSPPSARPVSSQSLHYVFGALAMPLLTNCIYTPKKQLPAQGWWCGSQKALLWGGSPNPERLPAFTVCVHGWDPEVENPHCRLQGHSWSRVTRHLHTWM